ncbi:Translocon at the outer membrane of chloroplasts 64, partial [Leucoagaricus sp. SymC.cos]
GNAAFKAGDYPTAIGHYTAAILANRGDATYPLNRAAAYLKLGKHEDAERDCNAVLSLSTRNVKAYFRRGQARSGLGNYIEAQRAFFKDFTEALRLEPDNVATKEELRKVAELVEAEKRKVNVPAMHPVFVPLIRTFFVFQKPSHHQINSSFDATLHPAPAAKRRRVPIAIVGKPPESPVGESAEQTKSTKASDKAEKSTKFTSPAVIGELKELSSRPLKSSPQPSVPDESKPQSASSQISAVATSVTPSTPILSVSTPSTNTTPKTVSFAEAKQAREVKTSKVGGGIFRSSGKNTIFPTKSESPPTTQSPPAAPSPFSGKAGVNVPPKVKDIPITALSASSTAQAAEPRAVPNGELKSGINGGARPEAPESLFDLVRAWRPMLTSAERWKLLQTVPPSSMPNLCRTSLEPPLLVSLLEVFLLVLSSLPTADNLNMIKEYMDNLAQVPRFTTLVLFLSGSEKAIAKEVWRKLGVQGIAPGAWKSLGNL